MKTYLEIIDENENANLDEGVSDVNIDGRPGKMNVDAAVNKPADENGSDGDWAVERPTAKDRESVNLNELPKDTNVRFLQKQFQDHTPFFIQGKAGWAKSSLIKSMAKAFGRTVITVYLDKAEPEELEGIPAKEMSNVRGGHAKQVKLLPPWAEFMRTHPDEKFFLFFDELNQASPGIYNALMPICNVEDHQIGGIRFKNYMVGAAGNLKSENDSLETIPQPLMARLGKKPKIWETNTPESWKTAFAYLRKAIPNEKLHDEVYANNNKNWTELLGEEFINKVEEICMLVDSPRDIERYCFSKAYIYSKSKNCKSFTTDDVQEDIIDKTVSESILEQPDKKQREMMNKAIEFITNFIQAGGAMSAEAKAAEEEKAKAPSRRNANVAAFGQDMIEKCAGWLIRGYVMNPDDKNDTTKYGISLENVFNMIDTPDDQPLTAEQKDLLKRKVLALLDTKKKKVKFETNKEFLDLGGYVNPDDSTK